MMWGDLKTYIYIYVIYVTLLTFDFDAVHSAYNTSPLGGCGKPTESKNMYIFLL